MNMNRKQIFITKSAALFHSRPLIVLYSLAEKYPATRPENTYKNITQVPKDPLLAGESMPSIAKTET